MTDFTMDPLYQQIMGNAQAMYPSTSIAQAQAMGPQGAPTQAPGMSFAQMLQMMKQMQPGQPQVPHASAPAAIAPKPFQAAMVNSPSVQAPPTLAALLAGRR